MVSPLTDEQKLDVIDEFLALKDEFVHELDGGDYEQLEAWRLVRLMTAPYAVEALAEAFEVCGIETTAAAHILVVCLKQYADLDAALARERQKTPEVERPQIDLAALQGMVNFARGQGWRNEGLLIWLAYAPALAEDVKVEALRWAYDLSEIGSLLGITFSASEDPNVQRYGAVLVNFERQQAVVRRFPENVYAMVAWTRPNERTTAAKG